MTQQNYLLDLVWNYYKSCMSSCKKGRHLDPKHQSFIAQSDTILHKPKEILT